MTQTDPPNLGRIRGALSSLAQAVTVLRQQTPLIENAADRTGHDKILNNLAVIGGDLNNRLLALERLTAKVGRRTKKLKKRTSALDQATYRLENKFVIPSSS